MEKFINNYLNTTTCCNLETGDFPGPIITISRQAGCSAQRIAIKLSKILTGYSYMSETKTDAEWKWVNKDIFADAVNEMVGEIEAGNFENAKEDIKLLGEVSQAFSEETIYDISDEKLIDTLKGVICKLAFQGRTIIVGRSAGVILKNVPNKLNIRFEAPVEWRINRVMQIMDLSQAEAANYINKADIKRDSFIEKIIGRKAENNDFDIIFNYASMEDDQIVDAVINILKNKKIISQHIEY
ncbi:MAG: cytidylate kinase-like family protein [Prolixibacteraceae bacterium]|jgi:cytidylate kinase|nr:cytidylate kinase-like family protein [Prolixibacteraceae bacterium]MBT6005084.1 cytidylate kinase-like family protein [Prolixibacteraceae bacterium]MBT6765856.1 cytidylate kinase-like family protein [Prolixibacteraceae bacterium]MBT6998758.1 cytidylate kinase-like family protein [Prolixibacteraceae bacterium]MBT7394972.1 cytidylate kinase-like family protein [Prolixibacteraceae bacterium]